ncbi:MAG: hypothetical protein J0I12_31830 [Candidatus Eremiobacteraeota bacterium]|nr:hypothetical protein [Candidatus Eremiobacteraeota bacterium]
MRKLVALLLLTGMTWADPTQKALKDLRNPDLEKRLRANSVFEEQDPSNYRVP